MKDFDIKIHEKAKSLAQTFNQTQIELINILQKIDRHKIFLKLGYSSLFQYALDDLHLSEANANNFITVSRKAKEIPKFKEAIQNGKLSIHKARKITPVLNSKLSPQEVNQWIDKAMTLPKNKLEMEVAKISPKTLTPERYHYVNQDRLCLQLGLSEEGMQRLIQIQDLLGSKQKKHVSLEDVIDTMSKEFVKRHDPIEKAKRREKKLSKKEKPIIRDFADEIHANTSVPGQVSWQMEARREAVAQWRKDEVLWRDQKQCTYIHANSKRCKEKRWLHTHHILPKSQGGGDHVDNLITLCRNHHQLIHFQSGWKEDQRTKQLIFQEKTRQQHLVF